MLRSLLSASLIVLSVATAHASSFCLRSGENLLQNGGTIHETLKAVIASYPRPQIPGYETDKTWCILDRRSLGGYMHSVVVDQPRLGRVNVNNYKIRYHGERIGHDHFVVKHFWLGPNNEQYSGFIVEDVDVVPEPF